MIGLGVGMAAAGVVAPQLGEMFKGMNTTVAPTETITATCAQCGASLPANAKFCLECGEKISSPTSETVVCPNCGKDVAKGKFCPECGYKFVTVCPKCGKDVPAGAKFCLECGEKL
jgi:predicted amidophosphoribosyltransferase